MERAREGAGVGGKGGAVGEEQGKGRGAKACEGGRWGRARGGGGGGGGPACGGSRGGPLSGHPHCPVPLPAAAAAAAAAVAAPGW